MVARVRTRVPRLRGPPDQGASLSIHAFVLLLTCGAALLALGRLHGSPVRPPFRGLGRGPRRRRRRPAHAAATAGDRCRRGKRHPGGDVLPGVRSRTPALRLRLPERGLGRAGRDRPAPLARASENPAAEESRREDDDEDHRRTKIAIGKSILTGAFCARSSAWICRRCRKSVGWARRMPRAAIRVVRRDTALANAIEFCCRRARRSRAWPAAWISDAQHRQDPWSSESGRRSCPRGS